MYPKEMRKQEKYLITGSSGFLGKELISSLKKDADVLSLSRETGSTFQIDISRPFTLHSDMPFDVVIHAAGKAHSLPKTQAEAAEFFKINFEGTQNLCNALQESKLMPRSFIFISTVSVYGLDAGEMINETFDLKGTSPYARSKIMAEEWLKTWAAQNNIILGILRLPLVAGITPPGNLGAMIAGIKSGRYLSIGEANARKSVVWARDIAGIVPVLAAVGGTYNLTDGYHPTLKEIENCVSRALQKKKPRNISSGVAKILGYVGDIVGERFPVNSDKIKKLTASLTFDDSLAVNILNWKPNPVLEKLQFVI